VVLAETFDHPFLALRHQAHPLGDGDDDENQHCNGNRQAFGHDRSPAS